MSFADEKTGLDEVDCFSDATSPASTPLYLEGGKQTLHKHTGFPQLICGEEAWGSLVLSRAALHCSIRDNHP